MKWTKLLIAPRRIFAVSPRFLLFVSRDRWVVVRRNRCMLQDLHTFFQYLLIFPWVRFCLIKFKVLTNFCRSLATWIFLFIIYTVRLKQFSHLRSSTQWFLIVCAIFRTQILTFSLVRCWNSSRHISCLCSSGKFHGSPKSKYSRFRKQSKAFIVYFYSKAYVCRLL